MEKIPEKLLKIQRVMNLLQEKTPYGGITVAEIAEKEGISQKTVRRRLETIEIKLGTPLREETAVENGIKVTRYSLNGYYLSGLSPKDAVAMLLGMSQQKASALSDSVKDVRKALVSSLTARKYSTADFPFETLLERTYIVEEELIDPAVTGGVFSRLLEALLDSKRIYLKYHTASRGEETERLVEPYGIACKRQNWYLVGYCNLRKGIRIFRVDQIRHVRICHLEAGFPYPEGFCLKEYMQDSWGIIKDDDVRDVLLKVSPEGAYLFDVMRYHRSQEITGRNEDGSILVSYRVAGIREMTGWIVNWGGAVEVIRPEDLRKNVADCAERILRMHS